MPKRSIRRRFTSKSYWKEKLRKKVADGAVLAADSSIDSSGGVDHANDDHDHDEVGEGLVFSVDEYHSLMEHSYFAKNALQNSPEPTQNVHFSVSSEADMHAVVLDIVEVHPSVSPEIHAVVPDIVEVHPSVDIHAVVPDSVEVHPSVSPEMEGHVADRMVAEENEPFVPVVPPADVPVQQQPQEIVLGLMKKAMPNRWRVDLEGESLLVTCMSDDMARITQRSAIISFLGNIRAFAHGHELPECHAVYRSTIDKLTDPDKFAREALSFVSNFRELEVCLGVYEERHQKWWKSSLHTCHIDNNDFHESRYKKTLRSNKCEYLVTQPKKFCSECYKVSKKLSQRKDAATWSSERRTPNKFKPSKCLTSAEKDARDKRKAQNIRNLQRKIARLRQQLDALIEDAGVRVDKKLDLPLGETLERHLETLKQSQSEDPKDKFFQIFLEQQLQARNAKGNHGIKWHPLMIRFSLLLKHCSQSSLNAARNFIRLPSDRLLWDYTHIYEVKPGVNEDFINEIAEEVKALPHEYQKYHVVSFDEVAVSENLVQRKSTGEIIGYQKLNEVQTELLELKQKLEAEAQSVKKTNVNCPPIAKKMLTFMVRGAASRVQSCIASYPVGTLSKEDLHQYVWEVTGSLENSGIAVVAFVCDGSAVNRGFFQMQSPRTKSKNGLILDIHNPYDPDRPIFFIPDPPHALKTARNCLENSGRKKSRHMKKNGESITWKPIIRIFKWKSEQTIKKLPRLTAACVYLNSYSRMSVPLCTRVMSNSLSSQFDLLKWPETKELSIFI